MEKIIQVMPNSLQQILEMQKVLLVDYIEIEGLPQYPLDINTKENQSLLKDFISRIIEEFSEAYEQYEHCLDTISQNKRADALQHLQQANEELADAWHFLAEFLIYIGIESDHLEEIIREWLKENPMFAGWYAPTRPWKTLLTISAYVNEQNGRKCILNKPDRFFVTGDSEALENTLYAGGRRISEKLLEQHKLFLWDITHNLNLLRGYLKNRKWSQTEKKVNQMQFENQVFVALQSVSLYQDFLGIGEIPMVTNYYLMNLKNQERIKNKY